MSVNTRYKLKVIVDPKIKQINFLDLPFNIFSNTIEINCSNFLSISKFKCRSKWNKDKSLWGLLIYFNVSILIVLFRKMNYGMKNFDFQYLYANSTYFHFGSVYAQKFRTSITLNKRWENELTLPFKSFFTRNG